VPNLPPALADARPALRFAAAAAIQAIDVYLDDLLCR
jgi:hypothetical protein